MEFNIQMDSTPDLGAIEHAIRAVDPSAQVDLDPQGHTVRVAASMDATELASMISHAGIPVAQDQITQTPSICCGGCGG